MFVVLLKLLNKTFGDLVLSYSSFFLNENGHRLCIKLMSVLFHLVFICFIFIVETWKFSLFFLFNQFNFAPFIVWDCFLLIYEYSFDLSSIYLYFCFKFRKNQDLFRSHYFKRNFFMFSFFLLISKIMNLIINRYSNLEYYYQVKIALFMKIQTFFLDCYKK